MRQGIAGIQPRGVEPAIAWGRSRSVWRYDFERFEDDYVEDLRKVKRAGYRLERVLIVDDMPAKVRRHHGNAVYARPFLGDPADELLPRLASYLVLLRARPGRCVARPCAWHAQTAAAVAIAPAWPSGWACVTSAEVRACSTASFRSSAK